MHSLMPSQFLHEFFCVIEYVENIFVEKGLYGVSLERFLVESGRNGILFEIKI